MASVEIRSTKLSYQNIERDTQLVSARKLIPPLIVASLFVPVLFAPADAAEEEWKTAYAVGKFLNSEPPKPDQIFKIQYRVVNGTLENFEILEEINDVLISNGISANVTSDTRGELQIKFPRNFPYTNGPGPVGAEGLLFFIGEHSEPETQADVSSRTTECLFLYSVPFSGRVEIQMWTTSILTKSPYHGDEIPDSCLPHTTTILPSHQVMAGVALRDVVCPEGLQVITNPDGRPYCVTPHSLDFLKERWNIG